MHFPTTMKAGRGGGGGGGGGTIFTKFHPHPLQQPDNTSAETTSSPPSASIAATTATATATTPVAAPSSSSSPSHPKKPRTSPAGTGDGSSIEVVRRPRGRPPGSKNKPKPPVVITRDAADSPNVMRPHILEIPAGHDVADALHHFSRRRDLGLSVLAGTGAVSNVTLRQPSSHSGTAGNFTFHGRFDILSISATIFPPSFHSTTPGGGGFSVSLAGPHGQIVGGSVAGPLVAAGTVTVVAAVFSSLSFHRLPTDDDVAVSVSVSGDDEQQKQQQQQQQQQQMSGAMPISSCHLLSDVIWAPAARAPHPPPY